MSGGGDALPWPSHAWLSPPATTACDMATTDNNTSSNNNNNADDVPLFLRDDIADGACARKATVAYTDNDAMRARAALTTTASTVVTTTTRTAATAVVPSVDTGVSVRSGNSNRKTAAAHVAVSSASRLDLTGVSGHRWRLRRCRILGKGSYGCATLYANERVLHDDDHDSEHATSSPPSSQHARNDDADDDVTRAAAVVVAVHDATSSLVPPTAVTALQQPHHRAQLRTLSYVVVKDVNVQTMADRAHELAALQSELHALACGVGHANVVQLLDCVDAQTSQMMVYVVLEYCDRGDVAALLEQSSRLPRRLHTSSRLRTTTTRRGNDVSKSNNDNSNNDSSKNNSNSNTRVESCRVWFDERGNVRESFVAAVLVQLLVGLHHLHNDHRIVHRDIKPHNLFLCSYKVNNNDDNTDDNDDGDDVVLRIGDCGSAVALAPTATTTTGACGSPYYMAPELHAERAYGTAADVWSAGVTLYELITRERPFVVTTSSSSSSCASPLAALSAAVMRGTHTPLAERVASSSSPSTYTTALLALVESMLTTSAAARPTVRRLLRSAYVRAHVRTCCPASVRHSAHYVALFGSDLVRSPRSHDTMSTSASPAAAATTAILASNTTPPPAHNNNNNNDNNDDDDNDDDDSQWEARYADDAFESDADD